MAPELIHGSTSKDDVVLLSGLPESILVLFPRGLFTDENDVVVGAVGACLEHEQNLSAGQSGRSADSYSPFAGSSPYEPPSELAKGWGRQVEVAARHRKEQFHSNQSMSNTRTVAALGIDEAPGQDRIEAHQLVAFVDPGTGAYRVPAWAEAAKPLWTP